MGFLLYNRALQCFFFILQGATDTTEEGVDLEAATDLVVAASGVAAVLGGGIHGMGEATGVGEEVDGEAIEDLEVVAAAAGVVLVVVAAAGVVLVVVEAEMREEVLEVVIGIGPTASVVVVVDSRTKRAAHMVHPPGKMVLPNVMDPHSADLNNKTDLHH